MEDYKVFLKFVNKFTDLSEDEFRRYIEPTIIKRKFAKKQKITQIGEVEHYFNLISKGLVRKYYKKGKQEVHTQISHEGQIILVQDSFFSREPSSFCLEAVEPTVLVSIQYDDLEQIFSSSAKMEHMGRRVITAIAILQDKWQSKLVQETPRERFLAFVRKNPDLIQRVPQKYLASLLNIKPETFSRFKHLLRSRPAIKD
ncbi:MAG: cyclic nucleotide-binding domain-containing protein [Terrimonas sp.]|nr:cyclic nucleotide-binding domain-containing protein [Terrimonas sp.]